jgi:hypothetical protein
MKKALLFPLIVIGVTACIGVSRAQQSVQEFNCVGALTTGLCADSSHGLRAYTGGTTYTYVSAAGFLAQGDGGGGEFYRLGSPGAVCNTVTFPLAAGTVGSTTIIGIST